jgi:hypothetical protein
MSAGRISEKVVTDRLSWIEEMLDGIHALPLRSCTLSVLNEREMCCK